VGAITYRIWAIPDIVLQVSIASYSRKVFGEHAGNQQWDHGSDPAHRLNYDMISIF
jgi:hypothetical protein